MRRAPVFLLQVGIGGPAADPGHALLQGGQNLLGRIALTQAQEHGVVSGEGAQDGVGGVLVQVGGHGGGITFLGPDHSQREGDFQPDDTVYNGRGGGLARQGLGKFVTFSRKFADVQGLEVAGKRGLGGDNAAGAHFGNEFFLAKDGFFAHNIQQGRLAGFDVLHSLVLLHHKDSE